MLPEPQEYRILLNKSSRNADDRTLAHVWIPCFHKVACGAKLVNDPKDRHWHCVLVVAADGVIVKQQPNLLHNTIVAECMAALEGIPIDHKQYTVEVDVSGKMLMLSVFIDRDFRSSPRGMQAARDYLASIGVVDVGRVRFL